MAELHASSAPNLDVAVFREALLERRRELFHEINEAEADLAALADPRTATEVKRPSPSI